MSIGAGLSHLIPATHLLDRKQRKGSKLLISFPFFCPSVGSLLFSFSFSLSFALFQNLGLPHGLISSSILVDGDPKLTGTPVRQE